MLSRAEVTRLGKPEDTLYLVDISSFIFRAFFAIRMLNNSRGEPTNAVYGVATMLSRLIEEVQPRYMAVCYDSPEPSFRDEIYEDYKANRSEPPDDLIPQFDRIADLIEAMKVPSFRVPGVEADDVIATLAEQWRSQSEQHRVVIVSGDKDLMQLVNGRTLMLDTMKEKVFGSDEVLEKFSVRPDQILDYLSLVGDSSDNIPGVPSIGPKTAATLLGEHENLKGVLAAAQAGKVKGKRGQVLVDHEKDAWLSHELVTLKRDVELDWSQESLVYDFLVDVPLEKLLRDLEFTSLLERWKTNQKKAAPTSDSTAESTEQAIEVAGDRQTVIVQDQKQWVSLLKELDSCPEFAFDLETTSLNPREAQVVGVALSTHPSKGYYIPVGHKEGKQLSRDLVLKKLKPYLVQARYKKLGQNLKYDYSVLKEQGIQMDGIGADTMIAAYLLDSSGRHNLDALAFKYLEHETIKYEDLCGKGKKQIGFDEVPIEKAGPYAAEDAFLVQRLWQKMQPELERQALTQVFSTIEMPLLPILAQMEANGIAIDVPWLESLSHEFSKELAELEKQIQEFSKREEPLNINSPRQLAQLLFEDLGLPVQSKTKTGYSTDASVLEKLRGLHPAPAMIVEYREIAKLKNTYVDPLPQMIDAKTGRIHGSFHQTVAATGRLSSSDPNLQNIPVRTERGQRIRRAFRPTDGNQFLSVDYSQMELRILAELSGDAVLQESFKRMRTCMRARRVKSLM